MAGFRLQIYDDGAGEYMFDAPVGSALGGGNMVGAQAGPFILPSPLAVSSGLVTVQMSNVNPPNNSGGLLNQVNPVTAFAALIFAVPKKCRGHAPTVTRRGVL